MFRLNQDPTFRGPQNFDRQKFCPSYLGFLDMSDSAFVEALKALPSMGAFTVTAEESRPDLISFSIYGETEYWWVLMVYNELLNFEDIVSGYVLKYPSKDGLLVLLQKAATDVRVKTPPLNLKDWYEREFSP